MIVSPGIVASVSAAASVVDPVSMKIVSPAATASAKAAADHRLRLGRGGLPFAVAGFGDQERPTRPAMHLLHPAAFGERSQIAADRLGRYVEACCKHVDRHFPFAPDDRLDLRLSFVRLHGHPRPSRPLKAAKVNSFFDRTVKMSDHPVGGQLDRNDRIVNS